MGRELKISVAPSRFAKVWHNETIAWEAFCEKLRTPATDADGITLEQYMGLPKDAQDKRKDVGGYVFGWLAEGRRSKGSVECRSAVCLDFDEWTDEQMERLRRTALCAWVIYSTRKHMAKGVQRVRVVFPLSRDVSPEEYDFLAREYAKYIGFAGLDESSTEASRLMYWPSVCKDAPYLCEVSQYTDFRNPDDLLRDSEIFPDMSKWTLLPGEKDRFHTGALKDHNGKRPEDPLEKRGVIGAFCRTFSVHDAVSSFLSDLYRKGRGGRYTWAAGSSANGAVTYDDGRFFISRHSTDPANDGHVHNAFDLVRLHKFGHLDKGADPETRVGRLPSFKAMEDLARSLPEVNRLLQDEARRYVADVKEDYKGIDFSACGSDVEREGQARWDDIRGTLEADKSGRLRSTAENLRAIFDAEPRLSDLFGYNLFAHRIEVVRPVPWRRTDQGPGLNGVDEAALGELLGADFGVKGKELIYQAVVRKAMDNAFHPVKKYLESLAWDGRPRLRMMLVDLLKADDTPLNRKLPELVFAAACSRIYCPGCKFDYMPILASREQGIGKSSLVSVMAGEWGSDSVTFGGKEGWESLRGLWMGEVAELKALKGKEAELVKAFISAQVDKYRPAYARNVEEFPRTCVLIGTTNDEQCLSGIGESHRRTPVVVLHGTREDGPKVREWLKENRDQLWAEALALSRAGEPLYLTGDLAEEALASARAANASEQDPLLGVIGRYLEEYVPANWDTDFRTKEARIQYRKTAVDLHSCDSGVPRQSVTVMEICSECLADYPELTKGKEKSLNRIIGAFMASLAPVWKSVGNVRNPAYGVHKTWERAQNLGNNTLNPLSYL